MCHPTLLLPPQSRSGTGRSCPAAEEATETHGEHWAPQPILGTVRVGSLREQLLRICARPPGAAGATDYSSQSMAPQGRAPVAYTPTHRAYHQPVSRLEACLPLRLLVACCRSRLGNNVHATIKNVACCPCVLLSAGLCWCSQPGFPHCMPACVLHHPAVLSAHPRAHQLLPMCLPRACAPCLLVPPTPPGPALAAVPLCTMSDQEGGDQILTSPVGGGRQLQDAGSLMQAQQAVASVSSSRTAPSMARQCSSHPSGWKLPP
jgi:hypothetical protein